MDAWMPHIRLVWPLGFQVASFEQGLSVVINLDYGQPDA